jgi:hypothetical protein
MRNTTDVRIRLTALAEQKFTLASNNLTQRQLSRLQRIYRFQYLKLRLTIRFVCCWAEAYIEHVTLEAVFNTALVWDDHIRTWLGIILDPAHLDYGTQNLGRRRSLFDHNV